MFKVGGFYRKVFVGGGLGEDWFKFGEIVYVLVIVKSELFGECWIVEDLDSVNFNFIINNVDLSLWEVSSKKDFSNLWFVNVE